MSEFFIDRQQRQHKEWRAKRLYEMRLEYMAHVISDEIARANKDWQLALRHQDAARRVTRRMFNEHQPEIAGELLTEWRDEAIERAKRKIGA